MVNTYIPEDLFPIYFPLLSYSIHRYGINSPFPFALEVKELPVQEVKSDVFRYSNVSGNSRMYVCLFLDHVLELNDKAVAVKLSDNFSDSSRASGE